MGRTCFVAPAIASTPFKLAEGTPTNHAPIVARVAVPGAVRLVLLNGRFAPELSDLTTIPVGLKVGSLPAAINCASWPRNAADVVFCCRASGGIVYGIFS